MQELFNREPGPGTYVQSTPSIGGSTASQSITGFGNGFVSKSDRFKINPMDNKTDPNIVIGPGEYEPKPFERHVNGPKFEAKTGFTLPFNENNPLNYARPITVNIYFKQQTPGIGTYDPEKPLKNIPACVNVFQSAVDRNANARMLLLTANEPAPTTYD